MLRNIKLRKATLSRGWGSIVVLALGAGFGLTGCSPDESIGSAEPEQGRSCAGSGLDCGPAATESCCAAMVVSGGTFRRSYDGVSYQSTSQPATVSTFTLDRFEVTVGRFRQMVEASYGTQVQPPAPGAGAHPAVPNSGWDPSWNELLATDQAALSSALQCHAKKTWTTAPGTNEQRPISCVTWFEAMAFCIWDGGRLPTEAEWNYAAAGGDEQRTYPWAQPPADMIIDHTLAVYDGAYMPLSVGSLTPQGDARWGHADMAGNVWEWVLDYKDTYIKPCLDCANVTAGTDRARRGGGVFSLPELLLVSVRGDDPADNRMGSVGFRCAR